MTTTTQSLSYLLFLANNPILHPKANAYFKAVVIVEAFCKGQFYAHLESDKWIVAFLIQGYLVLLIHKIILSVYKLPRAIMAIKRKLGCSKKEIQSDMEWD